MTKRKQRLIAFILCAVLVLTGIFGATPNESVYADSGYYIKNYDVDVKVNSDRTYDITETIDVYFNEESHGIIRDIPTWASEEREVRLQNVSVEGAPYEHDGYGQIRIGSADEYVEGDMRYVIKYTLWHYADEEPDYDYMYLNIIGTEWDTYIENYTSTVALPENAQINDITLTAGYYGETFEDYADYSVNGNVIEITSKRGLDAYEGITVNVQMLEGAFADALVWVPDLYIHSADITASLDEEGLLKVKEVFDVTVNYPEGLILDLKDYDEEYNSKIGEVVISYPSGRIDKDQKGENYCFIDLYDYENQRVTVSLEYEKQYYIREGQTALLVEQMVLPSDSDIVIENVRANVSMPFEIDEYSVKIGDIYDYYYGNYDQDIYAEFSDDMKSVSIVNAGRIDTDNYGYLCFCTEKGYFYGDYNSESMYTGISAVVVAIVAFVLMLIKRTHKYYPVVEFYPPDGMTPAEMGYIIDTKLTSRDMVSMIYYWASRGFLDIVFLSKRNFYLKYKSELSNYKPFEKSLFNGLWFYGHDTATMGDLKDRYYRHIKSAIKSIENSYGGKGSLVSKSRNVFSIIFGLVFPMLFVAVSGIYSLVMLRESAEADGFSLIMTLFFMWLAYRQGKKLHENKLYGYGNFMNIVRLVVGILSIIITAGAYPMLVGGFLFSDVTAFFMGLIMALIVFFSPKIKRRSEWGEELLNKTLGFRIFLETAEKERLELLLDENPQYFYDILPYAQVLGITKKWINRFDGIMIPPPAYVESNYGYDDFDIRDFDRVTASIHSAVKSMPSSSVGSGSGGGFSSGGSSGGGFSSGGSSGGGSGGGGGSRW